MADRIVVMRAGVVEQAGRPLDLYDRPRNLFVATFIGSPAMNLIDAGTDGAAGVLADGQRIALPASGAALPGRVKLGLRPEHLTLSTSADGIAARVTTCESTGSTTYLTTQAAGTTLTVTAQTRLDVQERQDIRLNIAPEHIHVFDAETGLRLGA